MYLGKNGERFPKEIFDRLSTEEQKNFKFVEDKEIFDLVEKANKTDCDLIMGENNTLLLKKRVISNEQKLYNEKLYLETFLNDTDYMSTKCYERKLDMETEYPEEYVKRQEARIRINELKEIIKK